MRLSRLFAVAIAAAAFAAVAPSAHAADDYFLKVDGVAGEEVPGQGLTGFIRINEFNWGAENKRTLSSTSGTTGTGKASFKELEIKKAVDANSPALLERLGLGTSLKTVDIIVRKAGLAGTQGNGVYVRYTFQLAFITDIEHSGGGDDGITETVRFVYGAAGTTFNKQDTTGKLTGSVFSGWNLTTNTLMAAPAVLR